MDGQETQAVSTAQSVPSGFAAQVFSTRILAAIVQELKQQGVPPEAALEGTDIGPDRLDGHTTRTSYQQLDRVLRNTLRLTRDPAIALHAGRRMRITSYGMYGYAVLSSETFDDVRRIVTRYKHVVGPLVDTAIRHEGATVVCRLEPMYWHDVSQDIYRFAVEFGLAASLAIRKDLCRPGFEFSDVALAYPAPGHSAVYNELFGCPVRFDQQVNDVRYDKAWVDGPMPLADVRSNSMAREMCDQLLREINQAGGLAAEVRKVLVGQLGHFPNMESIAELLDMHPRALRRKLQSEGTSFRELLSDVRMRLAVEYLRKTMLTNEEIAHRLGYRDPANFRHAFKRWKGRSPSAFRFE